MSRKVLSGRVPKLVYRVSGILLAPALAIPIGEAAPEISDGVKLMQLAMLIPQFLKVAKEYFGCKRPFGTFAYFMPFGHSRISSVSGEPPRHRAGPTTLV